MTYESVIVVRNNLIMYSPFNAIVGNELINNRSQCVKVENDHSSWGNIQRSILGPHHLYNHLSLAIQDCEINMYADDTTIHTSDSTLNKN